MYPSCIRAAQSISPNPLSLQKATASIYPPIPSVTSGQRLDVLWVYSRHYFRLYRRLLRAHRKLPIEMRSLGDAYVKDGRLAPFYDLSVFAQCLSLQEFRRHQKVTNPVYIMGFLTQWKIYLDELPRDPSVKSFKKLDPFVFEKVTFRMHGES